jgi:hypothetical protein
MNAAASILSILLFLRINARCNIRNAILLAHRPLHNEDVACFAGAVSAGCP